MCNFIGISQVLNGSFEAPNNVNTPKFLTLVDKGNNEKHDVLTRFCEGNKCKKSSFKDQICVEDWRSDFILKQNSQNSACTNGNPDGCREYYLHSPDWFSTSTFIENFQIKSKIRLQEQVPQSNNYVDVFANTGNSYIGIGPGELLQQELDQNNQLLPGNGYTLSLYLRPVVNPQVKGPDGTSNLGFGSWSNPNKCTLRVYLRTNDAEYTSAANNLSNFNSSIFFNKTLWNANTHQLILEIEIDLNQYPAGIWHPITVNFIAPTTNYKWLIIETEESNGSNNEMNHSTYLALDDISISESCLTPSCSRIEGIMAPQISGVDLNTNSFIYFSNLDNISKAKLEVFNSIGQPPLRSIEVECINGLPVQYILNSSTNSTTTHYPIQWDGKNDFGSNVANGNYILRLTVENNCKRQTFIYQIIKSNNFTGVIEVYPPCSSNQIPIECCDLVQNIYIDNITFEANPVLIRYVASGAIIIGSNGPVHFETGCNVEFQAGIGIYNGPNITSEPGTNVHEFLKRCSAPSNLRPSDVPPIANEFSFLTNELGSNNLPDLSSFDSKTEELIKNAWDLKDSKELIISNTDNDLTITAPDEGSKNIVIYSVTGELIFTEQNNNDINFTINTSNYAAGLYFIHIMMQNGNYSHKFFVR